MDVTGSVEAFGYGWLHITINTLLPHCRYQSPNWLSDTIRRLLDSYEACGKELPFFERAMLIIDEHTAMEGRHIFDQDNKGWKAVSNAIKGRLIPDDDQHTLAVALLSTAVQSQECCHITVLPLSDAHDFFSAHSSDYAPRKLLFRWMVLMGKAGEKAAKTPNRLLPDFKRLELLCSAAGLLGVSGLGRLETTAF